MSNLLKGKDVASYINEQSKKDVLLLKENNINPTLSIVRIGNNQADLSYENNAKKRCAEIGVEVKVIELDSRIQENEFFDVINRLNNDNNIHGILVFRPLPKHISEAKLKSLINPNKDVDGISDISLAGVFTNSNIGFPPCTAQAVIEILDYYKIDVTSKNVVVLGRSLVVGKPLSMLLLNKNATVTICHTKTKNISDISKNADILIAATGKMESIGKDYVNSNQTIIDVGINYNEIKQKLCGDVIFDEVESIVKDITPVPGGVGSVTTSILISHVVKAAKSLLNQ